MKSRVLDILFILLICLLFSCSYSENKKINSLSSSVDSIVVQLDSITVRTLYQVQSSSALSAKKMFKAGVTDSLSLKKAQLLVPQGSLQTDKEISITAIDSMQIAALPVGMVNVTAGASAYRFLPHGEHFVKKLATVVLPFDSLKIPAGYTAKDIYTYYYDEKHKRWEPLKKDTIDIKGQLAFSLTEHFTDMINGILKVPESPETSSITPTFISDYQPINPTDGITQIQAPVANSQGTAVLNYPLNLPTTRAGLTPLLNLQYNSDGGSSYVGYGFSIPIEVITIDTRWGCPLFDSVLESESYLLNGKQFTEKAHNHNYIRKQERQTYKSYFLRVDSEFLDIVRMGDNTKNYSWQVKDKGGFKKTYTGFDGEQDFVDIHSRSTDLNQIEWVLTEVEDKDGNTCHYAYKNFGGILYPKTIQYTGNNQQSASGIYKVIFTYSAEKENVDFVRKDRVESYRLGIAQQDTVLLSDIKIYNEDRLVRGYVFEYVQGVFNKTHLSRVSEIDSQDSIFYSHSFDYYDDLQSGMYADEQQWHVADSLYKEGSFFLSSKEGYNDDLSLIHGAHSNGYSVGGGAHVGVGLNNFISVYAGSSYNYTFSQNNNKVSLTDLNGDGLADLVFMVGDTICYRENLLHKLSGKHDSQGTNITEKSDSIAEKYFGETVKLTTSLRSFSRGESETHNLLVDAGAQVFFLGGNACYSHSWQKNKTTVYLYDFNSDGLIDIANNGTVYFNHIDSLGIPTFTTSSLPTPCPILGLGVPIDSAFIPNVEAEQDSMSSLFPRHDVVKLWRAPYDGKVNIEVAVKVHNNSVDGIRFSIQHASDELYSSELIRGESKKISKSVTVRSGDRIYFRLQSNFNAVGDAIEFSPMISYTSLKDGINEDENGDLQKYVAADEFLYCGAPLIPLTKKGTIHIKAPFTKNIVSDDICLIVRKTIVTNYNEVQQDPQVIPITDSSDIERRYLSAAEKYVSEPMDIYLTIDERDIHAGAYLSFEVESNSQIRWEEIHWSPVATYIDEEEPFIYVAPTFTMYNKHVKRAYPQYINKQSSVLTVSFEATNLAEEWIHPDKVNFSLKDTEGHVYFSSPISALPVSLNLPATTLYGTFHVKDEVQSCVTANYYLDSKEHPAAVYSYYADENFGHLYRGWGQFAYNGESEPLSLINEEALIVDTQVHEDAIKGFDMNTDFTTFEKHQLDSLPSVNDQQFYVMQFSAKESRYESIAKDAYVASSVFSASRIGRQDLHISVPNFPQHGSEEEPTDFTASPYITSSGVGDGFTGSASIIASVGGGWSKTVSHTDQSVLDVNGDGYPDWINRNDNNIEIIYTNANGQLTADKVQFDITSSANVSESTNLSAGVSLTSSSSPDLIAPMVSNDNWQIKLQKQGAAENTTASIGVNGNFAKNQSVAHTEWIDFNADGLYDFVYKAEDNQYYVRYNIGGRAFTEPKAIFDEVVLQADSSRTYGAGLGVNVSICGKASAGGGISMNYTDTDNTAMFKDMNGDGWVDYVCRNGDTGVVIRFNVGGRFTEEYTLDSNSLISSKSTSRAISCNMAVPVSLGLVNLTPSVATSKSDAISKTTSTVMDLDGDGFLDIVSSYAADKLTVRRNKLGRTGKLKSVTLPLKGKINLDYTPSLHNYRNPISRYCLSMIEVTGGSAELGATSFKDTITYHGGYYNRCERTFIGFDTVTVSNLNTMYSDSLYRSSQTVYATQSFYTRNLILSTSVLDSSNTVLSRVEYDYELIGDTLKSERIFPALIKKTNYNYQQDMQLTSSSTYDYDTIGNIISYSVDNDLKAAITYHSHPIVKNIPRSIIVSGGAMNLQKRESKIDDKGNVVQLSIAVDDGLYAIYDMEYDEYGNIVKITKPANNNDERVSMSLKYDDLQHLYPIQVSDSYGFTSYMTYDTLFYKPIKQTDINGSSVIYSYDKRGRLSTLLAPNEQKDKKPYTLKFAYLLTDSICKGITYHNSPEGEFEVYSFVDSLGRAKYTERTAYIYMDGVIEEKIVRSAYDRYDAFARKTEHIKAHTTDALGFEAGVECLYKRTYDELDRPVQIHFIDGSVITQQYQIAVEKYTGTLALVCTTIDAEGRKQNAYTDARGRLIATEQFVNGETLRVLNTYDALSRLVKVIHPNEHVSTYQYNMLGNVIATTTPDAGTIRCAYTPQGQLLKRITANGEEVNYDYDFERLKSVAYAYHPQDSILYSYGDSLATTYQKGRLLKVCYAMGSEAYTYGSMGEVVGTIKSIVIDSITGKVHTYSSASEFDSWGRVQKMTYPDGEVVNYIYYPNGQLSSMVGEKDGIVYPYLAEVGYSESGQIAYRRLGNNSEHRYFYDSKDRLQTSVLHLNGVVQSENHYSYDKVDNITSIVQSSEYTQRYSYDDLNRLIAASGYDNTAVGTPQSAYIMTMEYNNMSSPVNFTQVISSLVNPKSTTYSYHYSNDSQPNAPVQIGDIHYTYDAAGNPTSILDANGIGKDMVWDAENRLRSISDSQEGLYHSYAYDHTGERILKRHGSAQNAYINGEYVGTLYASGENFSAYVSPYFVETNNGYTKHYYAGATRLVSKIGESVYADSAYVSYGDQEKDQYYYFHDHLGSSTYITDINAEVAQYTAYTPYGELFREYRNVTPYKFNGKELDAETGLYYYGARYYNPATALWLGVDPLASKYPGVSPYVYCVSNPVKYIDPDGRELVYSFKDSKGNRVIVECAKNYYDNDKSVSVWAHGSEDYTGFVIYDGSKREEIIESNKFEEFLTKNSDVYVENQITHETTLIIMHSCGMGKDGGFAQRMSEELNIVIVAPSDNVQVETETATEKGVKNGGTWNVFYRGKKVDSFEGTKKPIFEDPEQAIKTFIAKYKQLYENKE